MVHLKTHLHPRTADIILGNIHVVRHAVPVGHDNGLVVDRLPILLRHVPLRKRVDRRRKVHVVAARAGKVCGIRQAGRHRAEEGPGVCAVDVKRPAVRRAGAALGSDRVEALLEVRRRDGGALEDVVERGGGADVGDEVGEGDVIEVQVWGLGCALGWGFGFRRGVAGRVAGGVGDAERGIVPCGGGDVGPELREVVDVREGVVQAAVGCVVLELRGYGLGVALPDLVADVEAGEVDPQVVVVALRELREGVVVLQCVVHVDEVVVEGFGGVDASTTTTRRALHRAGGGSPSDNDSLDTGLRRHELYEDGAGGSAKPVGKKYDAVWRPRRWRGARWFVAVAERNPESVSFVWDRWMMFAYQPWNPAASKTWSDRL